MSTAGTLALAGGEGSGPHPGSKRCVVKLHRYDR
jgi:hypothetical protein